jgi:hypothetical protein
VKGYPFEDGPTVGLNGNVSLNEIMFLYDVSLIYLWQFGCFSDDFGCFGCLFELFWWCWLYVKINGLVLFWKRIETGPTVKATFKTVWKNSRGLITWVIPFLFLELNIWDRLTIAEGRLKVIWFGSFHKLEQCWMFLDVECFFMIFGVI